MTSTSGPKAESVFESGEPDGWKVVEGWQAQRDDSGTTRVLVAVRHERIAAVHRALVERLAPPLSFLYRQKVDRNKPGQPGDPPRDFVALMLEPEEVLAALATSSKLIYHDARCEIWIRGGLGDQIVLDTDGLIFCYPYDPAFREVLMAFGLQSDDDLHTIAHRDYVKHWFHADCDAEEDALVDGLALSEVPHR